MQNKIIAITSVADMANQAKILSYDLGISYIKKNDLNFKFILHLDENILQLYKNEEKSLKPVFVDFLSSKMLYRIKSGGGTKQDIAKAVGIKGSIKPYVIDATAGLGKDAFVLASLGCRVDMIERSDIIAALLKDGLSRAVASNTIPEIIGRMNLVNADAIEYLQNLKDKPDVIYLDPMFPEKKKSALAKKEMQIFKELLDGDNDAGDLLDSALKCAKYRVVVKRPRLAESIDNKKPDLKIEGKSGRFDIYIIKSMKERKST